MCVGRSIRILARLCPTRRVQRTRQTRVVAKGSLGWSHVCIEIAGCGARRNTRRQRPSKRSTQTQLGSGRRWPPGRKAGASDHWAERAKNNRLRFVGPSSPSPHLKRPASLRNSCWHFHDFAKESRSRVQPLRRR